MTNSDGLHFKAFRDILREQGFNNGEDISEAFYKKACNSKAACCHSSDLNVRCDPQEISGTSTHAIFAKFLPDLDEKAYSRLSDDKEARFTKLAEKLEPMPGLKAFVTALDARKIKTCVVTNAPRPSAEMLLRVLKLDAHFGDRVVVGVELPNPKPHPSPFLEGLKLLGVSADAAIAFEDSPDGLRSAVASGCATIGVRTSQTACTIEKLGAGATVKDFTDAGLWAACGLEKPAKM